MGGKSRLSVLGDFPIVDEIMGQSSVGLIHLQMFLGVWRNAVCASSVMAVHTNTKKHYIPESTFNHQKVPGKICAR